ncbi:MAG: hypothetical protein ACFCD0_16560 [Gemmataceae bacterium]
MKSFFFRDRPTGWKSTTTTIKLAAGLTGTPYQSQGQYNDWLTAPIRETTCHEARYNGLFCER